MTMRYFSFSFLINVQKCLHFCFFLSRWGAEWTFMRNKMNLFYLLYIYIHTHTYIYLFMLVCVFWGENDTVHHKSCLLLSAAYICVKNRNPASPNRIESRGGRAEGRVGAAAVRIFHLRLKRNDYRNMYCHVSRLGPSVGTRMKRSCQMKGHAK